MEPTRRRLEPSALARTFGVAAQRSTFGVAAAISALAVPYFLLVDKVVMKKG